jgi:hypothetical protein
MTKEEPTTFSCGTQDNLGINLITKADQLEIIIHGLEKGKSLK